MARKRAAPENQFEAPPEKKEKKPDPFVELIQEAIKSMINEDGAPYKERVALIANAVKFLQVKNSLEGGGNGGDFWEDGDD